MLPAPARCDAGISGGKGGDEGMRLLRAPLCGLVVFGYINGRNSTIFLILGLGIVFFHASFMLHGSNSR